MNLSSNHSHAISGYPQNILFASIIWQMWKMRNKTVFQDERVDSKAILALSILWVKLYAAALAPAASPLPPHSEPKHVQWVSPPGGWICLNSNEVVCTSTRFGKQIIDDL
ncbi:hypothetical protein V6N11_076340 [Hibiscus sabdariffa]|uniref:Uncharacterized protein n=1 Tax=Hibiscus sabdariffa TaxID=183260 RepID=A0ABR2Q6E9_9ROSI